MFTLRWPRPACVVVGPLSAAPTARTAATVASGSAVPRRAAVPAPASAGTHRIPPAVAASSTRRAAATSSGPLSSPGISTASTTPSP